MPRLSTSDRAKARAARLLERLIAYANGELTNCESLSQQLVARWVMTADRPCLIVQTKLSGLAALMVMDKPSPISREHLRHDLRLFREFLNILEDNRTKTQGTDTWHFTLKLWHRSTQRNLQAFEQAWTAHKQSKPQPELAAPTAPLPTTKIYQNLPIRQHTAFIGFKPQLARLLELLAADHPATLISLTGTGGIGKTTLALEVAHRCWLATQSPMPVAGVPQFGAIIFVSAKSQHFVGAQLTHRLKSERSLRDMLRVIFRTLDCLDGVPPDLTEQIGWAQDVLARQQTLLILDNLETLQHPQDIFSFLYELPATVKVILTSRARSGLGTAIELDYLSWEDGTALIQHYAQEKGVHLSSSQRQLVYQRTGGLPLAIVYLISQVAVYDLPIEALLDNLAHPGDLIQYCFAEIVPSLKGQPAYALLLTLGLFVQSASLEALHAIALPQAEEPVTRNSLGILYRLSLVESDQGRYDLHPLTRQYMGMELAMNPDFEQAARERWLAWYLNSLQPYRDQDWRDWQGYASLEQEWENIREVLEWCRDQNRYPEFKQLWQYLKGYTQNYGHWDERLVWMDWLSEAAQQQADWIAMADALYHASRTLYLFNQPEQTQKAIALSQQAWELLQLQTQEMLPVDLAIHLAALYAQQKQFDQAWHWLNQGNQLLQPFDPLDPARLHQRINIDYYKAEICLHRNDHAQAKQHYTDALTNAERIEWQRAIVYIKAGLAGVAIAQNQLDEAEPLLNVVLMQAEQHQDKRCLSFCQSYFARLEKARGNPSATQNWARIARESFAALHMKTQVAEMNALLES